MKSTPQDVSESVKRRNPHLYNVTPAMLGDAFVVESPNPPRRIRQNSKPLMNKLELALYAYLCAFFPSCKFHAQSIRFKLGNGIWYKPDVVCFDWGDKRSAACWEVKGPHAFRGGFENLKVAAYHYPEIRWTLVWKESERWQEQIVLP